MHTNTPLQQYKNVCFTIGEAVTRNTRDAVSSILLDYKKVFDSCVSIKILETLTNPLIFKYSYF